MPASAAASNRPVRPLRRVANSLTGRVATLGSDEPFEGSTFFSLTDASSDCRARLRSSAAWAGPNAAVRSGCAGEYSDALRK